MSFTALHTLWLKQMNSTLSGVALFCDESIAFMTGTISEPALISR